MGVLADEPSGFIKLVVNAIEDLYGGGFISGVASWLSDLLEAMDGIIASKFVDAGFTALSATAAALIILYFLIHLADQAMRDMFTLEKLIVAFVKMIAGVAICICAQDITQWIVQIGVALFHLVENSLNMSDVGLLFKSEYYDEFILALNDDMTGIFDLAFSANMKILFGHFDWLISVLIITIIAFVMKIAAFFIATSTVVMLCVRVYFAPIAVVSIFDGAHSSGLKYFKSIAAEACSLAGIIVVLYAASLLSSSLINPEGTNIIGIAQQYIGWDPEGKGLKLLMPSEAAISQAIGIKHVVPALIPQIAAVGGMGGIKGLMREVFGS